MPQPISEISSPDDPRLNIPFVTIYDQKSLGCSFYFFCLMLIAPIIYSILAPADQLRIAQHGILILTGLWIVTILSNRNYARKIRKTAQPGQATLVDKFIDNTGDTTTKTLIYTFNHTDEHGQIKMYQTRVAVSTTEEFNVPIGSTLHYASTPMKNRFNSLINHLPFMWIISPPAEFRKKINRWTLTTSFILLDFAVLAIWARAAYLATANIWLELSFQQAITPTLQAALSPQPIPYLLPVLESIPALALVPLIALFFIILSIMPAQE